MEQEVKKLLAQGVVLPSNSPRYARVILVKKSHLSWRYDVFSGFTQTEVFFDDEPSVWVFPSQFYESQHMGICLSSIRAIFQRPVETVLLRLTW